MSDVVHEENCEIFDKLGLHNIITTKEIKDSFIHSNYAQTIATAFIAVEKFVKDNYMHEVNSDYFNRYITSENIKERYKNDELIKYKIEHVQSAVKVIRKIRNKKFHNSPFHITYAECIQYFVMLQIIISDIQEYIKHPYENLLNNSILDITDNNKLITILDSFYMLQHNHENIDIFFKNNTNTRNMIQYLCILLQPDSRKKELIDYFPVAIYKHILNELISYYKKNLKQLDTEKKEYARVYSIIYSNRGLVYSKNDEYDKAILDYDTAIKLNPEYTVAYHNRGLAYYDNNQYNKAIDDFTEVIRIDSEYVNAYFARGLAYLITGKYDKVIDDFTEVIRIDSEYVNAYFVRGAIYVNNNQYDKAFADFNKLIELNPTNANAYYHRGFAYAQKGEYDKAFADFNESIKLNPTNAHLYNHRGIAYLKTEEYDKAIADFNESIKLNSTNADVYWNRGFAYLKTEEYDKAIADFNESIKLNSTNADVYYHRGFAYFKKSEYGKAREDIAFLRKLQRNDLADLLEQFLNSKHEEI